MNPDKRLRALSGDRRPGPPFLRPEQHLKGSAAAPDGILCKRVLSAARARSTDDARGHVVFCFLPVGDEGSGGDVCFIMGET